MKLTNGRVLHLNAIMQALGMVERSSGVFKLDGLTRLRLVRNTQRLEDAVQALNAVQKAMIEQTKAGRKPEAVTDAENAALNAEWQKVLADETEVLLVPVKMSHLNIDANGLPQDLLKIKELVIDDMPDDDAKPAAPSPNVVPIAAGKA